MEYELDLDAAHVVEWLKRELASGGKPRFEIDASKMFFTDDAGDQLEAIAETDDLQALSTVGILEVKPLVDSGGHWLLRIRIEDVLGSGLPEGGTVSDESEEMTLQGFEEDFVKPDRGTAQVTVELETDQDRQKFERFLSDVQTDRHAS